jgi:hypothetical protein
MIIDHVNNQHRLHEGVQCLLTSTTVSPDLTRCRCEPSHKERTESGVPHESASNGMPVPIANDLMLFVITNHHQIPTKELNFPLPSLGRPDQNVASVAYNHGDDQGHGGSGIAASAMVKEWRWKCYHIVKCTVNPDQLSLRSLYAP